METKCPSCGFSVDREMKACPECASDLKGGDNKSFKKLMMVFVAIMLLTSSVFIYFITQRVEEVFKPKGIEIDGDFEDWTDITSVSDDIEHTVFNQNIDIYEYKIDGKLGELSFDVKVMGNILEGEPDGEQHVDTFYFFIDTDQDPTTGYFIKGIGSDFMIEIYGWGSEVLKAGLFSYSSPAHDWDLWEHEGSADVEASGVEMEAQVKYKKLGLGSNDNVDAIIYARSWDGYEDFADLVVSNDVGIMEIAQWGVGPSVIDDRPHRMLRMRIRAWNSEIVITELKIKMIGTAIDSDVLKINIEDENGLNSSTGSLSEGYIIFHHDIIITPGQYSDLYCQVEIHPLANTENTIGFRIENNHDVTIDKGTVSMNQPNNDLSYMIKRPENVSADGAFFDWNWRGRILNDRQGDVLHEDLDILSFGLASSDEGPSFYLRVDWIILKGEEVPHRNEITLNNVDLDDFTPKTGENKVYIFIDTLNNSGFDVNIPIQADYMIEIRGWNNQITSRTLYRWEGSDPNEWSWVELGFVQAAIDTDQLEVTVGWDDIEVDPENDNFEVFFMTADSRDEIMDFSGVTIPGPVR
jgi:hypothetical protein